MNLPSIAMRKLPDCCLSYQSQRNDSECRREGEYLTSPQVEVARVSRPLPTPRECHGEQKETEKTKIEQFRLLPICATAVHVWKSFVGKRKFLLSLNFPFSPLTFIRKEWRQENGRKKLIVESYYAFSFKIFLRSPWWLGREKIYVHAITPNCYLPFSVVDCGLIALATQSVDVLALAGARLSRGLFINFHSCFQRAKTLSRMWADGGESLTKQLFDNGRVSWNGLRALFMDLSWLIRINSLNTFLNPSI